MRPRANHTFFHRLSFFFRKMGISDTQGVRAEGKWPGAGHSVCAQESCWELLPCLTPPHPLPRASDGCCLDGWEEASAGAYVGQQPSRAEEAGTGRPR